MSQLLIISTSTISGSAYLAYIEKEISQHFQNAQRILLVPFARPGGITHEAYTAKAANVFKKLGLEMKGAHEFTQATEALNWAEGVFVGGGNTFLLLKTLYETNYFKAIQQKVNAGLPYMGTSAGANMTGLSIGTTNDMPIVYPPSFDAFGFVPFNINPHYLDPNPNSKHMGETRETRIQEFHLQHQQAVVGLREGSALKVTDNQIEIIGDLSVRLFECGKKAREISPTEDLSFLLG